MRITVDASPLLMRSAGVKSYLYHWIRALMEHAGLDTISTFPGFASADSLHHEQGPGSALKTHAWLGLLAASQRLGFPIVPPGGIDLFHCSNQVRRAPRGCLLTTTLHDLTCWLMPEVHTRANIRADFDFAEKVLCRADMVIAVSDSTRRDAIRSLGIQPRKIVTIHSGVPEQYFDVPETEAARVSAAWRLAKPFVLSVGTIEPRKNIARLLDAWTLLPREIRESHELILAGPVGWGSKPILDQAAATPGVRHLGYVPEADIPGLTKAARVLAYPSLYEGFGFPVAQAMAAGTAVLTSNVSSLPEVTGGAAELIDPYSPTGIAGALRRLLESYELRESLAQQARAVAGRYHWRRCAEESLALFHRLG